MSLFYSFFNGMPSIKKGIRFLLFSLIWLVCRSSSSACDTSGFVIDSYIDNGDGTFTVTMTIMVAGDITTDVGSTWGFYWNANADIVSVNPTSLTSNNGTTINAVIVGNNVTWGDPTQTFPITPFVDASAGTFTPDESFPMTVVLASQASEWWGGGQEGNNCPGGAGTFITNYEGDFPCFPPAITPLPILPSCPGVPIDISVSPIPFYLTDNVVWEPGGLMGETVTVSPTETTEYTVTASNICDEVSITVTVEVIPFPTIFAIEEDIVACENFPVVLEVSPANELIVEWSPVVNVGNVLIVTPATSPSVYTATAINQCGEESVEITVTTVPGPSIDIINDPETICDGDSIELESESMNADQVEWQPVNVSGNNIIVSPDTTTQYIVFATSNCGVDYDTILVTVATSDTTAVTLEACEGESVLYNGIPLSAGSNSNFTFENLAGCDSVVMVTVIELPIVEVPIELSACDGETVEYEGQTLSPGDVEEFTFTAANGCDSIVTVTVLELPTFATPLQLAACNGSTVQYEGQTLSPGSVTDFTFAATNGCDSVVTVTVLAFPTYDIPVMLQTCTGSTIPYNGQQLAPGTTTVFDLTTVNGCDSTVTVTVEELDVFTTSIGLVACTGTTASYNGQALMPGTVTDFNFTTALGCDSIVTVTVVEVTAIEEEENFSACAGESITFDGQQVAAGTVMDFNYTTAQGCDSIVTVTVEEFPTYAFPLTFEACTGSSILYNGVELFPATTTDVVLMTMYGCDSIITVTVDEVNDVTASLTLGACEGETVNFNGQQLAAGSVTDFSFISSIGCDSILTVTVEEFPAYGYAIVLEACTGSTVTFNNTQLPPGTTIGFNFSTVNGCDSIINVTVVGIQPVFTELEFETCPGTFITYNGQQLPPNTETDFTFTAASGCDSIVTVTVDEAATLFGTDEFDACPGSTITYNGQTLASGTVTNVALITAAGCDSIVTVTVNELDTYAMPLGLQACTGSTVTYNGQQLTPNTVTDFTFTASNGCDSIVTVTVDEVLVLTETLDLEACTGNTVTFGGQQLLAGTVTDFNFISSQGCDSILTVTVNELLPQVGTFQTAACTGETIAYNGQQLLAGTVTDVVLTAANGCDSVVTVTVNELVPTTGSVTLQGCEGETLLYNGTIIPPSTSMDFTLVNIAGCDSIVTVTVLDPIPFVETFETIEVCEGESAIIFGQAISDAGVYSETYTSISGCDSIHSITLFVANDLVIAFQDNITIGLGETVVLNPLVPSSSSLTYIWTEDPTLSCFDCQHPIASPLDNTTYFLTVVNDQGCNASADVQVLVRKNRDVYIPNSFSPNDDGINDVFMVFSNTKVVANILSFRIFSRWGESLYEYYNFPPNDPTFGWNGKHREEILNPAVFAYVVEIEFVDGVRKLYKGDVTIVK